MNDHKHTDEAHKHVEHTEVVDQKELLPEEGRRVVHIQEDHDDEEIVQS